MKKTFRLIGLDCANCASKMERKISSLNGVNDVVVNFLTTKMILDIEEENSDIIMEEVIKTVKSVDSDVEIKRA